LFPIEHEIKKKGKYIPAVIPKHHIDDALSLSRRKAQQGSVKVFDRIQRRMK
jgi:hypothetical protein